MWAQATGGSTNFSSHAVLPESQDSREFRWPGGHPTWVEGTGAKEEKVSDGEGEEAEHGPTGTRWRRDLLGASVPRREGHSGL